MHSWGKYYLLNPVEYERGMNINHNENSRLYVYIPRFDAIAVLSKSHKIRKGDLEKDFSGKSADGMIISRIRRLRDLNINV